MPIAVVLGCNVPMLDMCKSVGLRGSYHCLYSHVDFVFKVVWVSSAIYDFTMNFGFFFHFVFLMLG